MSSDSSNSSGRQVLKASVAVICCQKLTAFPAGASTTMSVDQITDVNASAATNMFRFEPDLVTLDPSGAEAFRASIETMRAKARERTAFIDLLDRYTHA